MLNIALPVIIIGGGGHAKVVLDVLQLNNYTILGVADHKKPEWLNTKNISYLDSDEMILQQYQPETVLLANGIGSIGPNSKRERVFDFFCEMQYHFSNVIHPSAIIAADVVIGEGCQVMAGAVIQPGCTLGRNALINTSASIDHDCVIGDHVHIAPGATLSGGILMENGVHIGTGAVLVQGVSIRKRATVGAGTVVINDVAAFSTVVGVPARLIK